MRKTKYLPPICWVHRPRHDKTVVNAIDEGLDLCEACADKMAATYREQFPGLAKEIFTAGGNDPGRESDSPAQCHECAQPLSCVVIETGRLLDTEAKWLRHP